jgi:hypothetical protein
MTNLTLAFEADVPGVDHRCLEAYDLCQNHIIETLEAVANQLGVKPLEEFSKMPDLPTEQAMALMFTGWDEETWGPEPDDLWHDAAEGLATVRAIRQYLREHPKTIRSGKRELGEFEKALESASQLGVRFHCYFDV